MVLSRDDTSLGRELRQDWSPGGVCLGLFIELRLQRFLVACKRLGATAKPGVSGVVQVWSQER